ncbi:stimulated by retinoic acid gene 6 protein-like isoform X1 [Eucyclogobius newberryi]|uniref:stimulated by retinoic acid gene 6 protein-like isoform X1 n=2 Tax=Eucyclogobius newberryi TaxID=166745 RepID=UPI003B5A41B2
MDWMEEEEPGCDNTLSTENGLHFSLIPAVLIVGVLSFLQRRTKKHAIDQKLPFLQGRFGIVIPMDVMGFSHRWSYGFAFGAISYSVLELFNEQHMLKVFPTWAKAIALLIGAFEVGLAYFPFFACLSTPHVATGAVMGICYSIFWITVVGWDWFTCPYGEVWGHYEKLIYQWPWMLSLVFLLGRFVFLLVKAVFKQCKSEQEGCKELMHAHQIEHVKRLLRKAAVHSKPLNWFQRHVYAWDPHFKFPNRLIGTAIISVLTLYMVTLIDHGIASLALKKLDNLVKASVNTETPEILNVIWKCHHVTLLTASLNMVAYVCHVLVCYRKQIKRLWKGHKDFLPKKLQNPSSAISVASIAKYSGCQIAFTLWGYVIVRVAQLWAAFLISYGLVLPIINGYGLELFKTVGTLLLTFGLVLVLLYVQELLVLYLFLQDKISPTDDQKPLALNNRNAFNCFNFFFFLYNVVMGITSCFFRMMTSFMLGTFLVSRIDRTIMQKGYETLDWGYRTWIGMIFADHYHNHPVLVCFIQLLLCQVKDIHNNPDYSILNNAPSANCQAKKRWILFYTLLKNPHLIPLRKHHLCANVPLKLSSTPQADIVVRAWLMRSQAKLETVTDTF